MDFKQDMKDYEKVLIDLMLTTESGKLGQIVKTHNISKQTLLRLMKKHNLKAAHYRRKKTSDK